MATKTGKIPPHEIVFRMVCENPGLSYTELAHLLGIRYSYIESKLASMEKAGLLLYEDEGQRLYPYIEIAGES